MSNGPNLSRTAAIDILLSSLILCISVSAPVKCAKCGTEVQEPAEDLRMGIPALRQYIDATMSVAPIGNGVSIISKFYVADFFFCSLRIT